MLTEKAYILCILSVLQKYSDADHILTIKKFSEILESNFDIKVDRRTIYRNINHLIDFGYDISVYEENKVGYYLRGREFEPSELRLLADAVLAAEFIPQKEGKDLIHKLQELGSKFQTQHLNRLAYIKSNKKIPNREIFLTIEVLDEAIRAKQQVEFEYVTYDIHLKQVPRRKEKYIVSPYSLYWSNSQYYLISNMEPHENFCHFRLDRVKNIKIKGTPSKPVPRETDIFTYANKALFMFGGHTEAFTLKCNNEILNDVVDQFGDDITIIDSNEATFTTIVKATSGGMKLWAIHYLSSCQVLSPEWLVKDIIEVIRTSMNMYHID